MNVKKLRKVLKKYDKKAPVVFEGDDRTWAGVEQGDYEYHCGGVKIQGIDKEDAHTVRLKI